MIAHGIPTGKNITDYGVNRRINVFNKLIEPRHNEKILDLGCGYGVYTKLIKNKSFFTIGADILSEHINIAKYTYPEIDFFKMDGTKLAFKDNIFDIVYMIETMEHVLEEASLLREICRILKSGGYLILSVPNKLFPFETHSVKLMHRTIRPPVPFFSLLPKKLRENSQTAKVYTERSIKALLKKNCFTDFKIEYITPVMEGRIQNRFKFSRKIFEYIENSQLKKFFGMSIVTIAIKK